MREFRKSSMSERRVFEWDDEKASSNLTKHGASFPYAASVFLDPRRADLDASRTADREMRWKTIGMIEGRVFTVANATRADDSFHI